MFERILVPLDGSKRAERAFPVTARIADATDGTVILVSVVNRFVLLQYPQMERKSGRQTNDDLSMSEAEAYLEEIACSPELAHVKVEKVILSGPVAFALLSAATSCRADLIVLTSHTVANRGREERGDVTPPPIIRNRDNYHRTMQKMPDGLRAGGVTERVISRATIPVLLLHENGSLLLGCPSCTNLEQVLGVGATMKSCHRAVYH